MGREKLQQHGDLSRRFEGAKSSVRRALIGARVHRRCAAPVLLLLLFSPAYTRAQPQTESDAVLSTLEKREEARNALRALYVPGGLTSDQAVEAATRTSPTLRSTKSLVRKSEGDANEAMSGVVPQLQVNARATRLTPAVELFDPGDGDIQRQYSLSASVTYSFTRSLAESLPAYRAAKKNKEAAAYQITAETHSVAFQAQQAYYEFARAKANVGVAQSAFEAAQAQRDDTALQVNVGTATAGDLLRVQAQFEATNVDLERARLDLQVAERSLQAQMHTDVAPTLGEDLSAPVPGIPRETEAELLERALRDRPDLKALRVYVEATEHQLRSANGGRLPNIQVLGTAAFAEPNFLQITRGNLGWEGSWIMSASLEWSPNATVSAQGASKRLQAELQQASDDVTALVDSIRVEVAEGYSEVHAAEATFRSASVGLNAAQEAYRIKRRQLRAGIVNTAALLQAQSDLIRAQVDLVDSAVGLRISKAQLLRAIGVNP